MRSGTNVVIRARFAFVSRGLRRRRRSLLLSALLAALGMSLGIVGYEGHHARRMGG